MFNLVVFALSVQCNAGVVPSVRGGGHNGAVAGSSRREAAEGGLDGEAPGGFRARNRHRRVRTLGGSPVCGWAVQEEVVGWHLWGIVQKVPFPFLFLLYSDLNMFQWLVCLN